MTRAERLEALTCERFGLIELLQLEADGTRWRDADHPRAPRTGIETRRRDQLRAAAYACEVRHGR